MTMRSKTFNDFAMLKLCPGCNDDIASDDYRRVRWFRDEELAHWFPVCDACLENGNIDAKKVEDRVLNFICMGAELEDLQRGRLSKLAIEDAMLSVIVKKWSDIPAEAQEAMLALT
jgi:hypothetical protein